MTESQFRSSTVEVNVEAINLISGSGTMVNIWAMCEQFKLNESLFLPICYGECLVLDGVNTIDNALLKGFDHIAISFGIPDNPKAMVTKTFRIYNIAERQRVSNSAQTYKILFCSDELFLASEYMISKSFKGKKVSEIVKDIAINTLKISPKKLEIEETTGTLDQILPYMRPLEAINKLSRRALTKSDHPSYTFYETLTEGFKFKSIEALFKQPPVAEYSFKETRTDSSKIDPFSVIQYTIKKNFDTLADTQAGKFAASLMTFDIIRGVVETVKFDSEQFFKKHLHLEGKGKSAPKVDLVQNRKGDTQNKTIDSHARFVVTTLKQKENSYIKGRQPDIKPQNVEKTDLQRNAFLQNFMSHRIKLVTPGNPTLKSGDIIELKILSSEDQDGEIKDEKLSGKYIVTTVTHFVTKDRKYFLEITVMKDDLRESPTPEKQARNESGIGRLFG